MNAWIVIIGMGLITFAIRVTPIILLEHFNLNDTIRQGLRFVPAAVLSAIVFPALLMPNGQLDVSLTNVRLLAGLLAALVAWRTKNVLYTIAVGLVVLWLLQWLIG
ncbi:MAG: AzlD domain-containing protein [Candidatus Promineifilaceae bacterium]